MKRVMLTAMLLVLYGFASAAQADDNEEVLAAMTMWKDSLAVGSAESPDKILALYAEDAVLWGTISSTIRAEPAAIRDYFVNAYTKLPGLTVEFEDPLVRVYGDVALNSGYYTFTYQKDGEAQVLPARYSFALVKRDGAWLIADHHSSAMPK
ncbi:MAG: SgcJ/EcaC family oxidoreductase [Kiloniellales bacterium]